MAAIDIGWTPSTLRDVSMALDVCLRRVPQEGLCQTAIAENWRKAHEWLQTVQRLTDQPDEAIRLDQIPPFPLTSKELQALQASIDRIAQAHAAASPTLVGTTARHVRSSLGRLISSAYALGAALLVCVMIAVIDVTLFRETGSPWYFGLISLGAASIALITWALHLRRLGVHKAVLNQAHPLPH